MGRSADKAVLAAALLLLAVVAITLGLIYPGRKNIAHESSAGDSEKNIPSIDAATLAGTLDSWNRIPAWQPGGAGDPFLAEKYMMYPNGEVTPVDANTMIDGLPLAWLLQNGIDFHGGSVANDDPDGDGFSNKQEYLAHTNPRDPKSHPPYISRLRLKAVDSVSFKVVFNSYSKMQGAYAFSINLPMSQGKQSRFARKGENIDGFVITDFRQKGEDPDDRSELDFEKPNTGIKVTVGVGKTAESIATFARFNLLLPGQLDRDIRVEVGKPFEIPQEPNSKYTLVSATDNSAVIRTPAGQEITIAKATPDEEKEVSQIHEPGRRGGQ